MAPEIAFIVNPAASNGRARARWRHGEKRLRALLRRAFDVHLTERPGHATELTRTVLGSGATTVVAVGGDGTVNEVLNGFLDAAGRPPRPDARLAVLPIGTGADFVKTLGGSHDPEALAERIQEDVPRWVDAGRCEYNESGSPRTRCFANVGEFGSGGAVVDRVNRTTKILGGRMSFLIAILRTMPRYRNTRVAFQADGGPRQEVVVNDFVVANGRYFGAGLMPAPHASLEDGLFDVVIFGDVDFRTVRRNLPALRRGEHLSLPEVRSFRCRELTVHAGDEMIDLDGEFVGRRPVRFECLPRAVPILA